MKKRFREALSARCKDMGLTDKAIDNLTELGCKGLSDTSTEEEINSAVDSIVPFAREMQAEITRKYSKKQPSREQSNEEGENEGKQNNPQNQNQPQQNDNIASNSEFLKAMEEVSNLKKEIQAMKEEKVKAERQSAFEAELDKHGLKFLKNKLNLKDDEDIKEYVTKLRQEFINNGLPTKDNANEKAKQEDFDKQAATKWAESLPDKK